MNILVLLRSIEGSTFLGYGAWVGGAHRTLCSAAWRTVMVPHMAQWAWEGLPMVSKLIRWPIAGHCAWMCIESFGSMACSSEYISSFCFQRHCGLLMLSCALSTGGIINKQGGRQPWTHIQPGTGLPSGLGNISCGIEKAAYTLVAYNITVTDCV